MLSIFKRKKKKKPDLEILKTGYIYIILTLLLGVAGVNTGNNLIYLIVSAMLTFMGLSGFLSRINLNQLEIEIYLPEEIFAKTETPVVIKVRNRKRFFPSFLIRIKIKDKEVLIPFINNNSEVEKHITLKFDKRGENEIKEIEICSVFPFNFFKRCVTVEMNKKFLVYPYPRKCKYNVKSDNFNKYKGNKISPEKDTSGDIVGVRDYNPGDSMKLIHWKATAKTGDLKTKELNLSQFEPVLIDLEKLQGNLEDKISCATYLILKYYKTLQPFGLKFKNHQFKPEFSKKQRLRLLKFLANLKNKN
jgi:uncharacterized protein (DUF58 family)